jgi:phage I-like protein
MKTGTALCAAITIDDSASAPEWLHLLPAGQIRTVDGRGPFRVANATALMSASIPAGHKLPLDENHATDLAAPKGGAAPARGWIVELQPRADGIWGRVEWTGEGRRIVEDQQYRGVSPVIAHSADGTITAIRRASLTNTPNLTGLTTLHAEERKMDFRAWLIETLGLAADASDDAISTALKEKLKPAEKGDVPAALQSALAPIAALVGVAATADAAAVLAGVQQLKSGADQDGVITGLQSELTTLTGKFNTLVDSTTRKDAETFVDGAIAAGRVGLKPMRDDYISMHMENPTRAQKLIGGMPILKGGATLIGLPSADAKDGLSEADLQVVALMGIDRAEYAKTLAAEKESML